MSVHFYVIRADVCPDCHGRGQVKNPYLELWEKFPSRNPERFYQQYRVSVAPCDLEREVKCPKCAGTGECRRDAPLAEALRELGVLP